jgi:hypothetical protein
LILGQGRSLKIGATNMNEALERIKGARQELIETNKYQQDTNKIKILFCILGSVIILVIIMMMIAANKQ